MSYRFDPREGLIVNPVRLFGPAGDAVVRLALDTRATDTLVNIEVLVYLGYDPATAPERLQVTTGSSVEFCARIDGLLGLDFFRGCYLGIDLRNGEITVA